MVQAPVPILMPVWIFIAIPFLVALFIGLAIAMGNPTLRRGIWSAFGLMCAVGGVSCVFFGSVAHDRGPAHATIARKSDAISVGTDVPNESASDESDLERLKSELQASQSYANALHANLESSQKNRPSIAATDRPNDSSEKQSKSKDVKASRPAWIDTPPKSDNDTFYLVKKVGPYTTPVECEGEITNVLQAALSEYVELYLGREASDEVRLSDDELREHIVDRYQETLPIKIGDTTQTMYQVYLKLAFDHDIQSHIRMAWDNARVMARVRKSSAGLGGALGLLAIVYIGLRSWQPRAR